MAVNSHSILEGGRFLRGLTFDMRGGRNAAKLHCGRPLDGRVRARRCMAPAAFRANAASEEQTDRGRTRILN